MKRFQVSLSLLVGLIILAGVDLAIIRSLAGSKSVVMLSPSLRFIPLGYGFLLMPMANVLILPLLIAMPNLFRRPSSASFQVGFQVFGWASVLIVVAALVFAPASLAGYLLSGMSLSWRCVIATMPLSGNALIPFEEPVEWCAISISVGVPQLAIAIVGGWLSRRLGITVTIERRRPETLSLDLPVPTGLPPLVEHWQSSPAGLG